MNTVLFDPTDVLFFRDAVPMSAGQGKGAGCRMPFPSTLHEAFRTSLLTARAALAKVGHAPRPLPLGKMFIGRDDKKVASFEFQSLRTAGPFPWQEFDSSDPQTRKPRGLLLPVPLDVAFDEKRERLARLKLWRNESAKPGKATKPEEFRASCLPVAVTPPDKHGQLHGWWTLDQWRAYLEGRTNNADEFFHPVHQTQLWESEHRVGVQIDPASFASAPGQLYAGSYLRADARTRFVAQVHLQSPVDGEAESLNNLNWLLLGGDQRLARILRDGFADPFANLPAAPVPPENDCSCLLKWVLVTPAIFAHGTLPGWCWNDSDGRSVGDVRLGASKRKADHAALPGRAQLVSWCLGKPLTVSGWDVVEQRAKPTMLAVPAGSVFYFLCENRDTAAALAKKLHWQPRSDFYGEKGCGYGLVSFDVRMHPTSAQVEALHQELFAGAKVSSPVAQAEGTSGENTSAMHERAAAYGAAAEASFLSKATATPKPWSHPWLDQLGLRYHRVVAEKLRAQPDLLQIAIENIDRWLSQNDYPSGPRQALLEWRGFLVSASQDEIVERMLDASEAGHQRRQNTPFAGILSDEERKQVREKYEQEQLVELARTITAAVPLHRFVVAGSQAFYGASGADPGIVLQSIEADVLLTGEDFIHRQAIEDGFGMASQYLARTGVFAHPVGLGTITVAPGWEKRLVPFGRDDGLLNVWTLEIHDLAASKLMAGREKDFEFLRTLLDHGLCNFSTLLDRLELLRAGVYANAIPDRLAKLTRHLREWKRDDLARSIPAQPHN